MHALGWLEFAWMAIYVGILLKRTRRKREIMQRIMTGSNLLG